MSWTEERNELLKKLWADGLSASQIANELGHVTRNAVIGKVHRLGLSGRAKNPPHTPRQRKPHNTPMLHFRPQIKGTMALAYQFDNAVELAGELVENIIPIGQRCTLIDVSDNKCRWPIGDPQQDEFFFCGGKPAERAPYCSYHARIAYQPAMDRRRDKRPLHR